MAIQLSVAVRNARLNAITSTVGASPFLNLYSGPAPASCAAAATGTLLAALTLPVTWEAAASGGTEQEANGPWTGTAVAAGTVGYFRLCDAQGNAHIQGTVGQGTGDLSFDNASVTVNQTININTFSLTDANT